MSLLAENYSLKRSNIAKILNNSVDKYILHSLM